MAISKKAIINEVAGELLEYTHKDIELATNKIIEEMLRTLMTDGFIEVRGFGTFCLHHYAARVAKDPRNGREVMLDNRAYPYFKASVNLRKQLNKAKSTN